MDRTTKDCEEDLDFLESNHDFESNNDDIDYDRNVTDEIEIGSGGHDDEVLEEREEGNENDELDELELPSSDDLLSQCSSDEDDSHNFPQFTVDQDNPQFEVGQIFSSAAEFWEAVWMYGA